MSTDAQNNPAKNGKPAQPAKKCSIAEAERRAEFCYLCLTKGMRQYAIKQAFRQQFGELSARQIENYTSRARAQIRMEANATLPELRAESLAFYKSIATSTKQDMVKVRARERMDSLLGLDAPRRQELSGPAGGAIQTVVEDKTPAPVLSKSRLNEILAALEGGSNGDSEAGKAGSNEGCKSGYPGNGHSNGGNGSNGNGHHGGNGENRIESLPA